MRPWIGTPHINGQCEPQLGVDCVNFACAVLDELHGYDRSKLPKIPRHAPDTSLRDRRTAIAMVRFVSERYPNRVVRDGTITPGDVIVTKVGENPGHILIAGWTPWTAWHAINHRGVCQTGIGQLAKMGGVMRVWYPTEKPTWAKSSSPS